MMKSIVMAAGLALAVLLAPAHAQNPNSVRYVLQIPDGCYPVAINPQNEQISTVCRGQNNWSPEGLQLFNIQSAGISYFNTRIGAQSYLAEDMRSGVGPSPWFQYWWLPQLDRAQIWRPR
ncbi:hypothetical protein ACJ4V0_20715 [Phreatobacter sp. HK31-P]